MLQQQQLPSLNKLLDISSLDSVSWLKEWLEGIIDDIFYYGYIQSSDSTEGYTNHEITLVFYREVGFTIISPDFKLLINPGNTSGQFELPIGISVNWPIKQYINNTTVSQLTDLHHSFNLLLNILELDDFELIKGCVNAFYEGVYNDFIDSFNLTSVGLSSPLSYSILSGYDDQDIDALLSHFIINEIDIISYILDEELTTLNDANASLQNLFDLITVITSTVTFEDLTDLLIPKISAEIKNFNLVLEFPENWFKPVDQSIAKSRLTYNAGSLLFHSENGIDFNSSGGFNFTESYIANTALTLNIENLKLDLRSDKNIPEATADGRGDEFKGVYIEKATIGFPNILDDSSSTISLVTKNMLIGSEGGVSGTIGIDSPSFVTVNDTEKRLDFEVSSTSNFVLEGDKISISGSKRISDDSEQGYAVEPASIKLDLPTGTNKLYVLDSENHYYAVDSAGVVTVSSISSAIFDFEIGDTTIAIEDFYMTFHQNSIVSSTVTGTIDAPGLNQPLDMEISFADGFKVKVSVPSGSPGIEVVDNSIVTLSLKDLELGLANDKLYVALQGKVESKVSLPIVDKFLPETIDIHSLIWTEGEGVDYDLDLAWKNGLQLGLSSDGPPEITGFEKVIPINKSKEKNFFNLHSIKLSMAPNEDSGGSNNGMNAFILLQGAQFNFGKEKAVSFTVDGLGLECDLTQPASGNGNLGPFNIHTKVVPPKGIGVGVDTESVKGSGYLYLDPDNGEYIGQVQLSLSGKKPIDITAIGILNTKMPDGSKGFSFITIISVTKLNIDLGGGFELDGLGGMLGIHRTMDTQFLRDNLKSGSIDNILFPENIETNLPGIISDMKSIYPIKRNQFLFGPIAKITYGKEIQIMDVDLGFAIEFSDPTKLVLIADVGIELANRLLEINVAAVGEINFTKKRIMFDASIYNSKLAGLTLQGDMAFRLFWGKGEKGFLLSVGGFHPDYTPPKHLLVNSMKRLSIIVAKKKNLKIFVEAYFALTSNTLQFGALASFMAKAGKLRIEAKFSLDTLFQFNPFRFSIAIMAYAAIKWGSKSLMSIKFSGKLTGTEPWNVKGKVRFKILFVRITGRVDKTWGTNNDSTLLGIDITPLIKTELESPKSWTGKLPSSHYKLASYERPSDAELILIHPMGTLTVEQSKVPLGITIEHFENQKINGSKQFNLSNVALQGATISSTGTVTNDFAPAQYYNLSDKDKLSRASFEELKSGLTVKSNADLTMDSYTYCVADYDLTMLDWEAARDDETLYNIHLLLEHYRFVRRGVSRSVLSQRKRAELERIPEKQVSLDTDRYVVVDRNMNYPDNDAVTYTTNSRSEAMSLMNDLVANDPDLDGELNIISEIELI